jgi:predicted DNA-binding transcriptional regulator AlpA
MTIMANITERNLLRPEAVAEQLGVSTSTLAKWRLRGIGPAFVKIGPRLVGYYQDSIDEFLAKGERRSTSDEAA